ncbi:uncharacterized protein LOC110980537 isoform X2 [Acanthaster planci]|uniref:Uncharacterized protein LOC110980537 isoform X2 n=1 Tax=Acanthaster planci TaxID=133434 RepID=A0A8B7YIG1_ACAPL|nr:uncharacterized protein LOC110980537 isoform X2 [Acanthaster planci]
MVALSCPENDLKSVTECTADMETSLSPNLSVNEKDISRMGLVSGLINNEKITPDDKKTSSDFPSSISGDLPRCISFDCGNIKCYNYGMSTKFKLIKNGMELKDVTRNAFRLMHEMVTQHGRSHLVGLLSDVFTACDALLDRVQLGCVKFVLRFNTREGLQKLWDMYSSGELAERMTRALVTDELVPGDKTDIAVLPSIDQSDFEAGMKFFDELEQAEKEAEEERRQFKTEKVTLPEDQGSVGSDQNQPGTSEMSKEQAADTAEDPMDNSDG